MTKHLSWKFLLLILLLNISSIALANPILNSSVISKLHAELNKVNKKGQEKTRGSIIIAEPELGKVRVKYKVGASKSFKLSPDPKLFSPLQAEQLIQFVNFNFQIRKLHGQKLIKIIGAKFRNAKNEDVLFVPFTTIKQKRTVKVQRDYEIWHKVHPSGKTTFRLGRKSPRFFSQVHNLCPVQAKPSYLNNIEPKKLALLSNVYLSLNVVADSRFYSLYKGDTSAIIAVALENVSDIYTNQLGITLRLDNQTIYSTSGTDPLAATFDTSIELLEAFLSTVDLNGNPNTDLFHLFTSARGYIDAVGLAYLGTVCTFPQQRSGWSDYSNGFYSFIVTVAHEIGHGLNASHDVTDSTSIMAPGTSDNSSPHFSTFSVNEITDYITNNGSCLSSDHGSTLPTPGSVDYPLADEDPDNLNFTIKGSVSTNGTSIIIKGKVNSLINGPLEGRVVELRKANSQLTLLQTTTTNSLGKYKFTVKKKKKAVKYYTIERMTLKSSPKIVKL